MPELGESVSVSVFVYEEDECFFSHEKIKVDPKDNVFPPAGGKSLNDAAKLAKNMGAEYHFTELIDINVDGEKEHTQYSAHHIIPGNESWPKTKLKKWVDKKYSHIKENIGYDVNCLGNGVSLPGWCGYKSGTSAGVFGVPWGNYSFQRDYAIASMQAVHDNRQFHDRHATYSKFVIKCLNKISEKMDAKVRAKKAPGCGNEDCMGGDKKKKYNPPYELISRLNSLALDLEGNLVSPSKKWRMPLFTSRWALAYSKMITGKAARKALGAAGKALR